MRGWMLLDDGRYCNSRSQDVLCVCVCVDNQKIFWLKLQLLLQGRNEVASCPFDHREVFWVLVLCSIASVDEHVYSTICECTASIIFDLVLLFLPFSASARAFISRDRTYLSRCCTGASQDIMMRKTRRKYWWFDYHEICTPHFLYP